MAQSALVTQWFRGKELAMALGINLSVARLGSVVNNTLSPWAAARYGVDGALCGLPLFAPDPYCFKTAPHPYFSSIFFRPDTPPDFRILLPLYASELPVVPQRPGPLDKQCYFSRSRFPEPDLLAPSPPLLLDAIFLRANTSSNLRVVFSFLPG